MVDVVASRATTIVLLGCNDTLTIRWLKQKGIKVKD
jgi:hypothetical protein